MWDYNEFIKDRRYYKRIDMYVVSCNKESYEMLRKFVVGYREKCVDFVNKNCYKHRVKERDIRDFIFYDPEWSLYNLSISIESNIDKLFFRKWQAECFYELTILYGAVCLCLCSSPYRELGKRDFINGLNILYLKVLGGDVKYESNY